MVVVDYGLSVVVFVVIGHLLAPLMDFREVTLTSPLELAHCAPRPFFLKSNLKVLRKMYYVVNFKMITIILAFTLFFGKIIVKQVVIYSGSNPAYDQLKKSLTIVKQCQNVP